MRHIETVRNYLSTVVGALLVRGQEHDQTKLQDPEVEVFEIYTPKLRDCTYGSEEYKKNMKGMQVAINHHNLHNRHHPEFYTLGPEYAAKCFNSPMERMSLIDLIEMICDWKAATLRHADGDIYKSIEMNQERFGYGDELKRILIETAKYLDKSFVVHHAEES